MFGRGTLPGKQRVMAICAIWCAFFSQVPGRAKHVRSGITCQCQCNYIGPKIYTWSALNSTKLRLWLRVYASWCELAPRFPPSWSFFFQLRAFHFLFWLLFHLCFLLGCFASPAAMTKTKPGIWLNGVVTRKFLHTESWQIQEPAASQDMVQGHIFLCHFDIQLDDLFFRTPWRTLRLVSHGLVVGTETCWGHGCAASPSDSIKVACLFNSSLYTLSTCSFFSSSSAISLEALLKNSTKMYQVIAC